MIYCSQNYCFFATKHLERVSFLESADKLIIEDKGGAVLQHQQIQICSSSGKFNVETIK